MPAVRRPADVRPEVLLVDGRDVMGLQSVCSRSSAARRLSGGEHSQCAPSQPLMILYCPPKISLSHSQCPQAPEELDELEDELDDESDELDDELELLINLLLKGIAS